METILVNQDNNNIEKFLNQAIKKKSTNFVKSRDRKCGINF
jgi:hypothetical protein